MTSSAALAEVEGERTTFLISVDNLAQRPKYIGRTLYFNKMQLKRERHEVGGGGGGTGGGGGRGGRIREVDGKGKSTIVLGVYRDTAVIIHFLPSLSHICCDPAE